MQEYFDAVAKELGTAAAAICPGVFFTGQNGCRPVALELEGTVRARYVRLSLGTANFFHLGKVFVVVRDENGQRNEATPVGLRTSSVYGGTAPLLSSGSLWTHDATNYGFHTDHENAPWADLDLGRELNIAHVMIFNREDGFHDRAFSLRVELRNEQGASTVIFDHYQQMAVAAAHIESTATRRARQPAFAEATELLCRAYAKALTGDFSSVQKLVDESPLPSNQREAIRKSLNNSVLPHQGRLWNRHGIRRTFRFWTEREKRVYLDFANQTIVQLQSISPYVCLGFGAVLGAVRDRGFIPHDDDLDIIIGFNRTDCPTIAEGMRRVTAFLTASGCSVRDTNFLTHIQVLRNEGKSIDVFVGLREGERISWYPQPRASSLVDDVFPPLAVKLDGVECPMPRNPFRYLETVYGPKWGTANSRWGHNWDRAPYEDIL